MKATLIRSEADALLVPGTKSAEAIEKAEDLLRRTRAIVLGLSRWIEDNLTLWPKFVSAIVGTVADDKLHTADALSGPVYGFPNILVAGKHLNTEASRVMLAGIVVRCVKWLSEPGDYTTRLEYVEAMKIGREAVKNVLGSVPYFVGWTGDSMTTPLFPCGSPTSPKAYSAITVLYPLLCTGLSVFVTLRQKKWLSSRLHFMSETMGLKQAELFARVRLSFTDPNILAHFGQGTDFEMTVCGESAECRPCFLMMDSLGHLVRANANRDPTSGAHWQVAVRYHHSHGDNGRGVDKGRRPQGRMRLLVPPVA